MKVTILSKELIVPSSPTPSDLKTYKFSFIDQQIPPYYIPLILYYSYDHDSTIETQSQITIKLKTSLSKTLTHFYPLAGRLTGDQNAVDCTDQGVQFLVARVESSNLLDIIKSPTIQDLNNLVKVDESYVEEQLAIQVNLFDCGGIAVGVSMSHRIGDACSISSFVSHWFTVAKRTGPHRGVRTKWSPTRPLLVYPTRVEVVTALIWKCGTMALGDCKSSVAFHTINFRRRTKPSLQDHQFGNLFKMAVAVAHPTENMASRVIKLRDSFNKIDDEYVKSLMGENGVEISKANFKQIRKFMLQEGVGVFRFGSWCRFGFNEGDFGWGKPFWVSSANFSDENSIVLLDSRKDDGIEAWVVMSHDNMHKFEENAELQEFVGDSKL
ncbi:hypothetical protein SSX86_000299 [Deinandra increscens subsp. villosa]|uniref:Uncharacterized protein n=1 Tax=Deinandra increscens subsp. villosa TaxID=3103831 RepID=A0AAP0DT36_9ASTR